MTLALVLLGACGRVGFAPLARGDGSVADGTAIDAAATDLLLHFAFESDGLLHDRATGHDATCTSCPISAPGVRASTMAARFDGTNCLIIPAADLSPPAVTFAVWVKQSDMRQSTMFGKPLKGATQFKNSIEMYSPANSNDINLIAGDATISVTSAIGSWHHIAGTFDGNTLTGYVDGVADSMRSGLSATLYADDPFRIGCDQDTGSELSHYFGDLDEVRLYDRVLTPAEIGLLATP